MKGEKEKRKTPNQSPFFGVQFATTTPPRTFILDTYAVSRPPSSARRFPATASILLGLFVVTVLGAAIAILINSFRQQQQASNAALEEKTFML